jgi:hypothetical protein
MAINAVLKFLQAARNLAKQGMTKEQILDFARREFGEVSDFLKRQIDSIFKKGTPSKSKIGETFGFKNYPKTAQKKKGEVVPIKEGEGDDFIDFVRKQGDEEGANKIQKEVDRINKAIEDADKKVAAKEALEKRTADIKKGDVEGEGIESLETSIKKIKETADEMKELSKKTTPESIFENMIKSQRVMAEGYKTGNIRTAVREFMRSEEKAGRLKLNKTDSFRIREYSPMTEDDPIDVFRRHYGEDALEAVDEIGDVFMQGESFSHYEELLRNSVDKKFLTVKKTGAGEYDASVVAAEKIRKAKEQEAKNLKILEEFDPKDRTKNADGGLIDILKL